jgi:hypothetical protein
MMTRPEPPLLPADPGSPHDHRAAGSAGHEGHGWLMIACCIPMLVVVGILFASGVVGGFFVFLALACTALMAFMMHGMHGAGQDGAGQDGAGDRRPAGKHLGH